MTYYKLLSKLRTIIAPKYNHDMTFTDSIVNTIMGVYMTKCGYYPENAIASAEHFVNHGVLRFDL